MQSNAPIVRPSTVSKIYLVQVGAIKKEKDQAGMYRMIPCVPNKVYRFGINGQSLSTCFSIVNLNIDTFFVGIGALRVEILRLRSHDAGTF